jgi:hypothetical protein
MPLFDQALVIDRTCEERLHWSTKTKSFNDYEKLRFGYEKKSMNWMQINSSHMEAQVTLCMQIKQKGCYEKVMSRKRGPVNYTTLKGLWFQQKIIDM